MSENKWKINTLSAAIKSIEEILWNLNKKINISSVETEIKYKKRCVVAVDYDNIYSALRSDGKEIDFVGFIGEVVKIGQIDALKIFIPYNSYHLLPNVNNLGYEVVICQKLGEFIDVREKREDKVDSYMYMSLRNFLEYEEITHVVIATHDKHSMELMSEAVKKRKKVILFGDKNKMNYKLVEVIEQLKIQIFPLPSKERKLFL